MESKIAFTLLVLLLSTINCKGQPAKLKAVQVQQTKEQDSTTVKNTEKHTIMKKIDIDKFNKNRDGDYNFTDSNGYQVRQVEDFNFDTEKTEGYDEYRRYPDSAYEYYCRYDDKGNITESISSFYNCLIGIKQTYDKYGYSHDGENYDTPYKFSVDALIAKMKKEYDVNLLDAKYIWGVNRYVEKKIIHQPFYEVSVRGELVDIQVYLINGTIGETLLVTTRETEWSGHQVESVLDEYIRTLGKSSKK